MDAATHDQVACSREYKRPGAKTAARRETDRRSSGARTQVRPRRAPGEAASPARLPDHKGMLERHLRCECRNGTYPSAWLSTSLIRRHSWHTGVVSRTSSGV